MNDRVEFSKRVRSRSTDVDCEADLPNTLARSLITDLGSLITKGVSDYGSEVSDYGSGVPSSVSVVPADTGYAAK
jgi:hypothetical protein